jgi:hypothetical protein
MGLGKTVQTIAAYLRLAEDQRAGVWPSALIACRPRSWTTGEARSRGSLPTRPCGSTTAGAGSSPRTCPAW